MVEYLHTHTHTHTYIYIYISYYMVMSVTLGFILRSTNAKCMKPRVTNFPSHSVRCMRCRGFPFPFPPSFLPESKTTRATWSGQSENTRALASSAQVPFFACGKTQVRLRQVRQNILLFLREYGNFHSFAPSDSCSLSLYIYIYISLRKTKTGHNRIINLFPSCYGYWYESITPKITGLLQI